MIRLLILALPILFLFLFAKLIPLYIQMKIAGIPLSFFQMCRWRLQNLPINECLEASIFSYKANVPIDPNLLINHYKKGGHLLLSVKAYVKAKNNGCAITLEDVFLLDAKTDDLTSLIQSLYSTLGLTIHFRIPHSENLRASGVFYLKGDLAQFLNSNTLNHFTSDWKDQLRKTIENAFLQDSNTEANFTPNTLSVFLLRQLENSSLPFHIIDLNIKQIFSEVNHSQPSNKGKS